MPMTTARINGLRSVELGVHDLKKSAEFYRQVWALDEVATEGDTMYLRGTGREHHVVTLRERPRASLLGVHFSAPDRAAVDALHAKAKAMGAKVGDAAELLEASAGGGYGFRVSTPEGHPLSISADVAAHGEAIDDRSRPTKLTHVVLNSAEGRSWPANVRRDPRVNLTVLNMENPYEFVSIKAHLVEDTHDGADEHIDAMAMKYLGEERYPFRSEGEERVILRFEADSVSHYGR